MGKKRKLNNESKSQKMKKLLLKFIWKILYEHSQNFVELKQIDGKVQSLKVKIEGFREAMLDNLIENDQSFITSTLSGDYLKKFILQNTILKRYRLRRMNKYSLVSSIIVHNQETHNKKEHTKMKKKYENIKEKISKWKKEYDKKTEICSKLKKKLKGNFLFPNINEYEQFSKTDHLMKEIAKTEEPTKEEFNAYEKEFFPNKVINHKGFKKAMKEFLDELKAKDLRSFYKKNYSKIEDQKIPKTGKLQTKTDFIDWIISRMIGDSTSLEKRGTEKTNLKGFKSDLIFFKVGRNSRDTEDLILPIDVMKLIVSYMIVDYDFINSFGLVNENFYILGLMSFRSLCVTKKNAMNVPLLVLENLNSLKLSLSKSIYVKEIKHILQNTKKLGMIEIENYDNFPKVLSACKKLKKEKAIGINGVESIKFSKGKTYRFYYSSKVKYEEILNCFENVTRFYGCGAISFLGQPNISEFFDEIPGQYIHKKKKEEKKEDKEMFNITTIDAFDTFRSNDLRILKKINRSTLQELKITIIPDITNSYSILHEFSNLKRLVCTFRGKNSDNNSNVFKTIAKLKSLESLVINITSKFDVKELCQSWNKFPKFFVIEVDYRVIKSDFLKQETINLLNQKRKKTIIISIVNSCFSREEENIITVIRNKIIDRSIRNVDVLDKRYEKLTNTKLMKKGKLFFFEESFYSRERNERNWDYRNIIEFGKKL